MKLAKITSIRKINLLYKLKSVKNLKLEEKIVKMDYEYYSLIKELNFGNPDYQDDSFNLVKSIYMDYVSNIDKVKTMNMEQVIEKIKETKQMSKNE